MSDISRKLDSLKIERPDEPERSRWWIPLVVVGVLAAAAAGWFFTRSGAAEVTTAVAREVAAGTRQTVLNASGYVTARRQATVSSKVTGKVQEVLIEEGMEVSEGQVLATLDDSNARAAVRLSEAQLEAAKADLAETRVRRHEASLDLARIEQLVELDSARANVDSLDARLASQQEAVAVAEQSVAVARQALADTVIRAPFAGIVVAKNAQPGEMISPMSSGGFTRTGIGTIVDMASLEIEVDVNEAYINRVTPGQRVDATLDAYPDWQIPAHVIAIIPTADRQTATVQVRVGFEALDPRILPDMGVKVAFQSADDDTPGGAPVVVVPRGAVRTDGSTDIVFVVADGVVERRAVRVGQTNGGDTSLLAGLTAGERVVVDGPADLADGDTVEERTP